MRPPINNPTSAPGVVESPKALPVVRISALLGCFQCDEKPEVEQPTAGIWRGLTIITCPNRCHEESALDPNVAQFFWNEWAGMAKHPNNA